MAVDANPRLDRKNKYTVLDRPQSVQLNDMKRMLACTRTLVENPKTHH